MLLLEGFLLYLCIFLVIFCFDILSFFWEKGSCFLVSVLCSLYFVPGGMFNQFGLSVTFTFLLYWLGWQCSCSIHDIWSHWLPSGDIKRCEFYFCIDFRFYVWDLENQIWDLLHSYCYFLNCLKLITSHLSQVRYLLQRRSICRTLLCYWQTYTCNNYSDFWRLQNGQLEPFLCIF